MFLILFGHEPGEMNLQQIEAAKKLVNDSNLPRFPLLHIITISGLNEIGMSWSLILKTTYLFMHALVTFSIINIFRILIKNFTLKHLWILCLLLVITPFFAGTPTYENLAAFSGANLFLVTILITLNLLRTRNFIHTLILYLLLIIFGFLTCIARYELSVGCTFLGISVLAYWVILLIRKNPTVPKHLPLITLLLLGFAGTAIPTVDQKIRESIGEINKEEQLRYQYYTIMASIGPLECDTDEPCRYGKERYKGGVKRFGTYEENNKSIITAFTRNIDAVIARLWYSGWYIVGTVYIAFLGIASFIFLLIGVYAIIKYRKTPIIQFNNTIFIIIFTLLLLMFLMFLLPPRHYVHTHIFLLLFIPTFVGAYYIFIIKQKLFKHRIILLIICLVIGISSLLIYGGPFYRYNPLYAELAYWLNDRCEEKGCITNVLPNRTGAFLEFDPYNGKHLPGSLPAEQKANPELISENYREQCLFTNRIEPLNNQEIILVDFHIKTNTYPRKGSCITEKGSIEGKIPNSNKILIGKIGDEEDYINLYKIILK